MKHGLCALVRPCGTRATGVDLRRRYPGVEVEVRLAGGQSDRHCSRHRDKEQHVPTCLPVHILSLQIDLRKHGVILPLDDIGSPATAAVGFVPGAAMAITADHLPPPQAKVAIPRMSPPSCRTVPADSRCRQH